MKGIGNAIAITICLLLLVLGGIAAAKAAVCSGDPSDPETVCCTYVIGAHHCYWDCDNGEQIPAPCPRPQSSEVGAECPANPNDPIGQLLCGETDCVRDSAWTGRSCRAQTDYWCCAAKKPPRPRRIDEARGFTLLLVDQATGLPTSADAESVAVSWRVIRTTTKGGLTLEDVVQSGVGFYAKGRLTTERGGINIDTGECEPEGGLDEPGTGIEDPICVPTPDNSCGN